MPSLDVPVTTVLGRVNDASFLLILICCYYGLAKRILEGNERLNYCIAKQET